MQKTSVALGLFDGVHLGHRAVLQEAKKSNFTPVVFTFPAETAVRKNSGGYIYSSHTRNFILKHDFDFQVACMDFEQLRNLSGEAFAEKILCQELHASHVTCGYDFKFGCHASCNVEDLKNFGKKFHFTVKLVNHVKQDKQIISSTEIRKLLLAGQIEKANAFLGAPYVILEKVSHGVQLGRTIGFPTVNQVFHENQLVPKFGVYASQTITPDGKYFCSITNIGIKPTVNYNGLPLAETYIKNFSGDLYDKNLQVRLLKFIRPEMKFDSVQALTNQMQEDLKFCF
ncbi:MAG: bifunctional riboflavin kinase/FAD synthetase [Oscillospiraceae bacterium]|nr:bifunctional riboflavin kinase/FAD synthetase [Oscillospiraceae bacterium]